MDGKSQVVFGGFGKLGMALDDGLGIGKGHGDGAVKSWQRDGDWLCPRMSCRNINFAFRSICNLCGGARPAGVGGKGASSGSWGCGMRPGGGANITAIGKKGFSNCESGNVS